MKILFVTLSNIGDCILTLPVLDLLREKFPQAKVTCLVPPRPKEIFINNSLIEKVIIFDKHSKLINKIKLFFSLGKEKFDLVVDLRNSFFGAFLPAKKRSSPFRIIPSKIKHMKDRHLFWAGFSDYPKEKIINVFWHSDNYHLITLTNKHIQVIESSTLTKPVDLIDLNQEELTAFYDNKEDILYFSDLQKSSDGSFHNNLYKLDLSSAPYLFRKFISQPFGSNKSQEMDASK